jgi:hypothetical protein
MPGETAAGCAGPAAIETRARELWDFYQWHRWSEQGRETQEWDGISEQRRDKFREYAVRSLAAAPGPFWHGMMVS